MSGNGTVSADANGGLKEEKRYVMSCILQIEQKQGNGGKYNWNKRTSRDSRRGCIPVRVVETWTIDSQGLWTDPYPRVAVQYS